MDDTIVTVDTISLFSYDGATISLMLNEFIMNAQVKLCLRLVLNWIQIDHRATQQQFSKSHKFLFFSLLLLCYIRGTMIRHK